MRYHVCSEYIVKPLIEENLHNVHVKWQCSLSEAIGTAWSKPEVQVGPVVRERFEQYNRSHEQNCGDRSARGKRPEEHLPASSQEVIQKDPQADLRLQAGSNTND